MSEDFDPIPEAVAVLRAHGHTVEPWTGGLPYWLVDGQTLTDGGLLELALRLSFMEPTTSKLQ